MPGTPYIEYPTVTAIKVAGKPDSSTAFPHPSPCTFQVILKQTTDIKKLMQPFFKHTYKRYEFSLQQNINHLYNINMHF